MQSQVDAVEPAGAAEHLLRGRQIGHDDVLDAARDRFVAWPQQRDHAQLTRDAVRLDDEAGVPPPASRARRARGDRACSRLGEEAREVEFRTGRGRAEREIRAQRGFDERIDADQADGVAPLPGFDQVHVTGNQRGTRAQPELGAQPHVEPLVHTS